MVNVLMYCTAVHSSHDVCNLTSAKSSPCHTVSREVPKLSRCFPRSILIEIDLLDLKMKTKHARLMFVPKNNEYLALSSDEISFGVDDASFPNHAWPLTSTA